MAKKQKSAIESPGTSSTYATVKELADDLSMCERSVRVALRRGEIPHRKIGKRYVLPKAAIRRWLEDAGDHARLNVIG